jgi:hypothetical protein
MGYPQMDADEGSGPLGGLFLGECDGELTQTRTRSGVMKVRLNWGGVRLLVPNGSFLGG